MNYYSAMTPTELAEILTHGARLACLKLTKDWQLAKEGFFQSNGAQFLHWQYQDKDGKPLLCEKRQTTKRTGRGGPIMEYRLTPLGLKVKNELYSLGLA